MAVIGTLGALIGATGLIGMAGLGLASTSKISQDKYRQHLWDIEERAWEEEQSDLEYERSMSQIYMVEKSKQQEMAQRMGLSQAEMSHDITMLQARNRQQHEDAQMYLISQAFQDFQTQNDPNEKYVIAFILSELKKDYQHSPSLGEPQTTIQEWSYDPFYNGDEYDD